MTVAGALLDVVDLRVAFHGPQGKVQAVDGVSLSLARGRTLGVVGETGSGKTVLLRSIMGLTASRSVERSGQVLFEGRNLLTMKPRELEGMWGRDVAMVFQDPMTSLNPVVRLGRQITEAIRAHRPASRKDAASQALGLLEAVRVPKPARIIRAYPHQLSGGMRQRVLIAMALACDPVLLLADEPTTALDVTVQAQILDLLGDAQQQRAMAMVLVTHDLGVVAGRADEIAVMYAGKVVEIAPTEELFTTMRMPYTEALVRSAPRLTDPRHQRLRTIPGRPPSLRTIAPGCAFAPRCDYAQERCHHECPPLRVGPTPEHRYACWYPVGTPEGEAALAGNQARSATIKAGANEMA